MKKKINNKKIAYWIASIAIAVATCVLSMLETSCCPQLMHNFAKGYEKWYDEIFYTIEPTGDTLYYTTKRMDCGELQKLN